MARQDRHEGVSCDGCTKENFRGRRYKCLACFDYDLCATCFDKGQATQRHTSDHSMQCILTQSDYEMFYGGESNAASDAYRPLSFSCPFCVQCGFTETSLRDHVTREHQNAQNDVICPVCAATPNGEPNRLVSDLVSHLTAEHDRRDSNNQADEAHRAPRRTPTIVSRGGLSTRTGPRRTPNVAGGSSGVYAGANVFAPQDAIDPIAELLSQLGGIRRAGSAYSSTISQIQQLQQVYEQVSSRQGSRRLLSTLEPRLVAGQPPANLAQQHLIVSDPTTLVVTTPSAYQSTAAAASETTGGGVVAAAAAPSTLSNDDSSRFLLPSLFENSVADDQKERDEVERNNRSYFVQELLVSLLLPESRGSSSDNHQSRIKKTD